MKISEFIQHTRTQIGEFELNDAKHLDDLAKSIRTEYQKVAADSGGQASVINGDGAVMLEAPRTRVEAVRKRHRSQDHGHLPGAVHRSLCQERGPAGGAGHSRHPRERYPVPRLPGPSERERRVEAPISTTLGL